MVDRDRLSKAWRLLRTYRDQSSLSTANVLELVRDIPPWMRTQGASPLDARLPWLTFSAIRELNSIVDASSRVLEYGAGGSTLFLAQRVREIVSVEHDRNWADQIREIASAPATIILAEPTADDPGDYVSTDSRYLGLSFRDYASVADRFPDGYFDVLLIDGRARPSTFLHGRSKVRSGGWVLLDNSERDAYSAIVEDARASGWEEHRHVGPTPYVADFGETTIWRTR